jgi:flagellar biosynthesis protein
MYDKNDFLKRKAAALKYQSGVDNSPKVVASGRGAIAESIINKAKEFEVPFFKNEALANSLLDINIGENIPPKLYKAVAEVFIWLLSSERDALNQKQREEAEMLRNR